MKARIEGLLDGGTRLTLDDEALSAVLNPAWVPERAEFARLVRDAAVQAVPGSDKTFYVHNGTIHSTNNKET